MVDLLCSSVVNGTQRRCLFPGRKRDSLADKADDIAALSGGCAQNLGQIEHERKRIHHFMLLYRKNVSRWFPKHLKRDGESEKMETSVQNRIRGRSTRVREREAAASRSWLYQRPAVFEASSS